MWQKCFMLLAITLRTPFPIGHLGCLELINKPNDSGLLSFVCFLLPFNLTHFWWGLHFKHSVTYPLCSFFRKKGKSIRMVTYTLPWYRQLRAKLFWYRLQYLKFIVLVGVGADLWYPQYYGWVTCMNITMTLLTAWANKWLNERLTNPTNNKDLVINPNVYVF